jgi:hydrogenase-4 component B
MVGSIAICGLPPLNGFVGELFLYVGAIINGIVDPLPLAALAAPVLALVGGLAVITFVKLYGIIFLGTPRSAAASHGHDAAPTMTGPMILLAVCCLVVGMAPVLLVRIVTPVVVFFTGLAFPDIALVTSQVPLVPLTIVNILLISLALVIGGAYLLRLRTSQRFIGPTWGCGYPEPTPRMQYTGTSFSEMAVSLLGAIVSPGIRRPGLATTIPTAGARFDYTITETVLDRILTPIFHWAGVAFSYLRKVQHGQLHIYMLYIFATLFILMVWPH